MPQLDVRRTYADGNNLLKQDLDAFIDDIETFLNLTKLNDDNFQDAGITASDKLIDGTVTNAKFTSSSIATAKINDSAVTTAKIADGTISTTNINNAAVTTAKIAAGAITTAKIADANVTAIKNVTNYALSSDIFTSITATTSPLTSVKSVSITTTSSRPVLITLVPDSGNGIKIQSQTYLSQATSLIARTTNGSTTYFRQSTPGGFGTNTTDSTRIPNYKGLPALCFLDDTQTAGTHTYTLYAATYSGGTILIQGRLLAMEL